MPRRQRSYNRYAEDDPPPPPYPDKLTNACTVASPCGAKCILLAETSHVYHTCNDQTCQICHSHSRFLRPIRLEECVKERQHA